MKRILLPLGFAATLALLGGCANLNEPERAPISLEEIVQMSKDGKDGPTIIGELKAAHMAYDLTASQYAKLSREGVVDAVIDYMQQTQRRRDRSYAHFNYYCNVGWAYCGPWNPRVYGTYWYGRPYRRVW